MSGPVLIGFESLEDLVQQYETAKVAIPGQFNVLLAVYQHGSYEGESFVLLERDGKLYEVNASHCSCYGLDGQFEPEETTAQHLRYRMEQGTLGHSCYTDETFGAQLAAVLDAWEQKGGAA